MNRVTLEWLGSRGRTRLSLKGEPQPIDGQNLVLFEKTAIYSMYSMEDKEIF